MKFKPRDHRFAIFLTVWIGQVISLIGSGLTSFALGIWVFEQTGSPTMFALIGLFAILPKVIFSPFAGILVDRFDRRNIMILADSGAGMSTIFIALMLFTGQLALWHIYFSATVTSICGTLQWPAYTSTVTQLVPPKHLGRANGLNQFGRAVAEIFSPLLAGVLILTIQLEGVILIDGITFIFAILTLLIVRFPRIKQEAPVDNRFATFKHDLTFGWNYIRARKGLLNLLFFQATVNFIWGMVGALIVPMILGFTSSDKLGAIITIAGTGMLTGSLLMTSWGGPKRKVLGILFFELFSGICFLLMGWQPEFWMVAIGAFGAHITIAMVFGLNQALWQTKVEIENQGRVFATQQMFASAAAPFAYIVAGPLAERVFEPWMCSGEIINLQLGILVGIGTGRGIGLMFVLMGMVKIGISLLGYFNPHVRQIEQELPDAIPAQAP